jgi:hypothetical protein
VDHAGRFDRYTAHASAKSGYNINAAFERLPKLRLDARKVSA